MSCTGLKGAVLLMATVSSTQLVATASSETPFYNISHPLENLVPMTDCIILNEIQLFALKFSMNFLQYPQDSAVRTPFLEKQNAWLIGRQT